MYPFKCLKQRQKIETNAINENNSNEITENNSIESNKISCKFCSQEVSPKSIRRHGISIKCQRLRVHETEVLSRKRNRENEETTAVLKNQHK